MHRPRQHSLPAHAAVVILLTAVVAVVAPSCTVGPDYKRPQIELPEDWVGTAVQPDNVPATQASRASAAAVEVARWWSVLDDPVLDSLIERAIESNLDLQQAASRIRQARGSRNIAESGLIPTVDTSARYSRSGTGATDEDDGGGRVITLPNGEVVQQGGESRRSTQRNNFRVGLDAAWEIDVFGGIRRDIEAAGAQEQAAVEDWRNVLVTLVSEVALNYIDLRQFQQQNDIAVKNLDLQLRSAAVTRDRRVAGFVGPLDLANAEAQVASTRSQIPSIETAERQAIYNLSVLLGQEPGALLEELSHGGPLPLAPPEVPVGLPSDLLRRRPDIRRAEEQVHAATAQIGVATADLFPRFTLTAGLGLQGDRFNALGDRRNYFWSYGPSMSWPLFDAGRIRANIRVTEASQEEALLAYRSTILFALQEVENALIAFVNEQERRQHLIRAVEETRKSVALSSQLYAQGNVEFLELLTAQRALLNSEDALAQSNADVVTNLIAIYKALGGGWESQVTP